MSFDIPKLRRKDTAPYEFHFPGGTIVVLHTRPLTLDTREVFNDAFRDRGEQRGKPADRYEERMANRAHNLETLARCCVPQWEGVKENGAPVDCSPAKVLEFLRFLDEAGYREEVTSYILWAQNPLNFREPLVEASKVGEG